MRRTVRSFFYPEIQRRSPYRPVAWRWQRAQDLVQRGRYFSLQRDDEPTGRAVHYLRALGSCHTERRLEGLARSQADVHAARLLHEGSAPTVVEIQARLLARQTPKEIAAITGVPVEVVVSYEALFFNVVDKLHARDWVTVEAIGWWRFDPARGRDAATVLRGFAYHGGLVLLEALLPYLLGDRMQAQPTADPTTPEGRLDSKIRLVIDLEMFPSSPESDLKLFKMHAEALEEARKARARQQNGTPMSQNVTETLEKLAAGALQQAAPLPPAPDHEAGTPSCQGIA